MFLGISWVRNTSYRASRFRGGVGVGRGGGFRGCRGRGVVKHEVWYVRNVAQSSSLSPNQRIPKFTNYWQVFSGNISPSKAGAAAHRSGHRPQRAGKSALYLLPFFGARRLRRETTAGFAARGKMRTPRPKMCQVWKYQTVRGAYGYELHTYIHMV